MNNTEKAKVKIKGITNMFHNKLECGIVEKGHELKKVAGKGMKPKLNPRKEALRVLFKERGKVFHPAEHLKGCLASAGADHVFKGNKTWKTILRGGLEITPVRIPLKDKWVVDTRPEWVGSGGRSFPQERHRPRFDKWSLGFDIEILDDRISLDFVKQMLMEGGVRYGIGDRRKRGAGKFEVTSFKAINEKVSETV